MIHKLFDVYEWKKLCNFRTLSPNHSINLFKYVQIYNNFKFDQKTPNTLFGSGEAPNKIDFQEDFAKEVLKMAQKFKSWAGAVSHKQCGHI